MNLKHVKRQILLRTFFGLLVIGGVLAATIAFPLHKDLKEKNNREIHFILDAKKVSINQFISKIVNVTWQFSSRTQIRKKLIAYNLGEVTKNELIKFSAPKLLDALNRSEDAVGVTRFDAKGEVAVAVGEKIPDELIKKIDINIQKAVIFNPVTKNSKTYLVVAVPIMEGKNQKVGIDVVIFKTDTLKKIVTDYKRMRQSSNVILAYEKAGMFMSVFPTRYPVDEHAFTEVLTEFKNGQFTSKQSYDKVFPNHVIVVRKIENTDLYAVITIKQSELNSILNTTMTRLLFISFIILIFGMAGIYILTYPLIHSLAKYITEQHKIEAELKEANEEAQSALKSKSEFLANMSHEIRTPMNAVIGLSKLLLDTPMQKRQQNYVENIYKSSNTLLGILNEILDFSKIEANRLEVEIREFETEELLDQINNLFAITAAQKGIELIFDVEPNVPNKIHSDMMRLSQIMSNLIGNAIKFTDKGEVHVRLDTYVEKGQTYLEVYVRDTGIGIDEEQLKNLFQPFVQADSSTTRKYGGTGLGLIISKKLVELLGGEIKVKSEPSKGSTFSFRVPLNSFSQVKIRKRYANELKGMKTLLVDDVESSVIALEKTLNSLGFNVTATTSSLEAYSIFCEAYAANEPFELILSDWKMPELDGLSLIQKIHTDCHTQGMSTPIIMMLTAYDREEFLAQQNSELVYAILDKPSTPSQIFDTIIDIQYGKNKINIEDEVSRIDYLPYVSALNGKKILLVEDSETNRLVALGFLEKMGLQVQMATNGQEAVDIASREKFDTILMDIQMPVMNGLDATKALRANGYTEPIIAMTAGAMQSDKEEALQAGMDEHLPKPIDDYNLAMILLKYIDNDAYQEALSTTKSSLKKHSGEEKYSFETLQAHFNSDEELMQKVLGAFLHDLEQIELDLKNAAAQNDTQSKMALAHKLKGAAGNLKAVDLEKLSAAYEQELKEKPDQASHTVLLQELQKTKEKTRQFLDMFKTPVQENRQLDLQLLSSITRDLFQDLKKHKLLEDTSLHKLLESGIDIKLYERFANEINAFDYKHALQTLQAIADKYGVDYE